MTLTPANMAKYYFAYGSNMNADDLRQWCRRNGYPDIVLEKVSTAVLSDYRLDFGYYSVRREGSVADVRPETGESVHGVIYRITERQQAILDRKEACDEVYERQSVTVTAADGTACNAYTYRLRAGVERSRVPNRTYLKLIIDAARRHGLPLEYIRRIETVPAADPAGRRFAIA